MDKVMLCPWTVDIKTHVAKTASNAGKNNSNRRAVAGIDEHDVRFVIQDVRVEAGLACKRISSSLLQVALPHNHGSRLSIL